MTDTAPAHPRVEEFIKRWQASAAAERANYQLFLAELCDALEVPRPDPAGPADQQNAYVFERAVTFRNPDGTASTGRIDLYKRACFVLEAKQGSERANQNSSTEEKPRAQKARKGTAVRGTAGWDSAMLKARGQAESYVRALPPEEGNPPFLIVVDVGHSIELYSDFSRSGKTYIPFPDPRGFRIFLPQLRDGRLRERLRLVWADPASLDPSKRSARVTLEVAGRLARLALSLERAHAPGRVSAFLMRAIFTMFAEDVNLIPSRKFTELLEEIRREPRIFPGMMGSLWREMNEGGFSATLRCELPRFNGNLFEDADVLGVTDEQLDLLIEAGKADWKDVEPAIFGTLLERALDPVERHKLGAHYTPRAYVERLVMPAIVEPLREDWEAVKAAAVTLAGAGRQQEAIEEIKRFHTRLCNTRVLDPACGTGNFLYVTLEHLKRLEGEVLDALSEFGERQGILTTVDPHQLLGIEVNPRAAAIADLVLWIGYLQWHFRTHGDAKPPEPVLKKFHNIECRDAVLAYDGVEKVLDEQGREVTRWDGRTMKRHAVTGEEVPDESARVAVMRYVNPRKAEWPAADFIIGNPPFIGNWRMRGALGDGYVEALRKTYADVPESSDYVMYWWEQAAALVRDGKAKRFGLIATNSLRQTFNRKVVQAHLSANNPLSLVFAIADHPWVDSEEGAAVRISMTVAEAGERDGVLQTVLREDRDTDEGRDVEMAQRTGKIFADLTIGADVASAQPLKSNERLSYRGVILAGQGFIITPEQAQKLGLGRAIGLDNYIKSLVTGRALAQTRREIEVIDLSSLSIEQVNVRFPEVYQWILERVKPERDQNADKTFREKWWIFGRPRPELRDAIQAIDKYIGTARTSKHRVFMFIGSNTLPESEVVAIALNDSLYLGILSSRVHTTWALASGGRLGVGNDPRYNNTLCFDTFPFPDCDEELKSRIRELGEALDAHRKRQQQLHPRLTITDMYNVLEKLRASTPLNDKEKTTHEQGLVSVLKQIHDELDRAAFAAYGWPPSLTDQEILERLVALNRERASEERRGVIRWLRPEFQNPRGATQTAFVGAGDAASAAATKKERLPWPSSLAEQARAVRAALASQTSAVTPQQLARNFKTARADRVAELLRTLASLGHAREISPGCFVA